MGCGASKDAKVEQPAQTKPTDPASLTSTAPSTRKYCIGQHETELTGTLLAEARDLLAQLPEDEAAALLATLRDSNSLVSGAVKEGLAVNQETTS